MDIIGGIIYVNPNLVEELSFASLIQKYWWLWIVIGTFLIILAAWEAAKKMEKSQHTSKSQVTENYDFSGAESPIGKQQADKIENYFGQREGKKKEDKAFDLDSLDFKFNRRWRRSRFSIFDAKLNSLLDYIKNGIATLFLYYQESETVSYETDLSRTRYYNPNIDKVIYHGVVFHGIKKLFEINSEGKKVKKEEIKMDLLFTIYLERVKKDNNVEIDIVMDGDGLYAEYFFNEFQKYVGKRFRVSSVKIDK